MKPTDLAAAVKGWANPISPTITQALQRPLVNKGNQVPAVPRPRAASLTVEPLAWALKPYGVFDARRQALAKGAVVEVWLRCRIKAHVERIGPRHLEVRYRVPGKVHYLPVEFRAELNGALLDQGRSPLDIVGPAWDQKPFPLDMASVTKEQMGLAAAGLSIERARSQGILESMSVLRWLSGALNVKSRIGDQIRDRMEQILRHHPEVDYALAMDDAARELGDASPSSFWEDET